MKGKSLVVAAALLAASVASAQAQGTYVGASGGVTFYHDSDVDYAGVPGITRISYEAGPAFNIAAGIKMQPVRLEAEFGYKQADLDEVNGFPVTNSDLTVTSYMLNGYYDFPATSGVVPFVGAGIGAINGEFSTPGGEGDDTAFGYQLTAGASFRLSRAVDFDIYYRFQSAPGDFEDSGGNVSYDSSNLMAGVRFNW